MGREGGDREREDWRGDKQHKGGLSHTGDRYRQERERDRTYDRGQSNRIRDGGNNGTLNKMKRNDSDSDRNRRPMGKGGDRMEDKTYRQRGSGEWGNKRR